MINKINKNADRQARHKKVRNKLCGTATTPRLCVYRSLSNIYTQIIDDTVGKTLVSASTVEPEIMKAIAGKSKSEQALYIGEVIAKRALQKKIKNVVFDRGGYIYTGRVKNVADGARNAGLQF